MLVADSPPSQSLPFLDPYPPEWSAAVPRGVSACRAHAYSAFRRAPNVVPAAGGTVRSRRAGRPGDFMSIAIADKKADLAGPGIGSYEELEKILPSDYSSLLDPKSTQLALAALKRYIEDHLCSELNLAKVEVPLIVDAESGVNDMLDRDGSRTPVGFHISNDHGKRPSPPRPGDRRLGRPAAGSADGSCHGPATRR